MRADDFGWDIARAAMLAASLGLVLACTDGNVNERPRQQVEPPAPEELPRAGAAWTPTAPARVEPELDLIEASFLASGLVVPNVAQPLSALPVHVGDGALANGQGIFVYADFDHPVRAPYVATSIYVVNHGDDTLVLPMVDWLSNFGVETRGPGDAWIVHHGAPRAWCGNSVLEQELPAQSFFRLEGPRWETGPVAELRFRNLVGPELVSNSGTVHLGAEDEIWMRGYGYFRSEGASAAASAK